MRSIPRILAAGALTAAALGAPAAAQITPDGLDGGPCCTPAQDNIPFFPKFVQESLEICWKDCDPESVLEYRARWSPLKPLNTGVNCGRYRARLKLRDPSGALAWKGRVNLVYSRTWFESDGANQRLQVWRFLVNMNLVDVTAGAAGIPCPVPPSSPVFNHRTKFTGYIDYAQDLNTGDLSQAWSMTHACDRIDHAPGFPRGGTFHPDRSYTFVGPAAGFAVSPVVPFEFGGSGFEAVRRDLLPSATNPNTLCQFEERIQSALDPIQELCLCGPSSAAPQWVISALNLSGACGTAVVTTGGPFLPGFLSMGVGFWTDPTVYPGEEILRWNCGGYDYFEPCNGVVRQEVFYGVSTLEGYDAFQINAGGLGPDIPETFIDQGNSLRKSDGLTTVMNIPYLTDHILNLNY